MQHTHFCLVETKKTIVVFESQSTILSTTNLAQTGLCEALSPGSSQLLIRAITQGLNGERGGRGREREVFPYLIYSFFFFNVYVVHTIFSLDY